MTMDMWPPEMLPLLAERLARSFGVQMVRVRHVWCALDGIDGGSSTDTNHVEAQRSLSAKQKIHHLLTFWSCGSPSSERDTRRHSHPDVPLDYNECD
jgi:hypothetical protein